MNEWLAAARAGTGCAWHRWVRISIADISYRPPRVLSDGEVIDIGGKRLRYIDTPHVRMAGMPVFFLKRRRTHFICGDLFAHLGNPPALQ